MFLHRLRSVTLLFLFPFLSWSQSSQTFSGGATGVIPDDMAWHTYPLNISTLNSTPIDTNWGFERVTLNITHTWDADLEVWLGSPDGTEVLLFSGVGGDGDNFTTTAFRNNYTTPISAGSAPFTGNYKPMGDLGTFNNGQSGIGVWYLKIRDSYPQDQGTLVSWSVRFSTNPSIPYPAISSNLPVIKINTNGQSIPDDPKIPVDFMIVDNGTGNRNYSSDTSYAYKGTIGIELRGSSSGSAPKKSYGFETWDAFNNTIDTPLLGMPAESDWILSASYYDKTLMRNVLSYHLANQTGRYASRTRYCEVILNGQYQGVYILMEKIKRDEERVDIAKLTESDTSGDDVTGGYILKIDKFTGSGGDGFYSRFSPSNPSGDTIYIQYEYPKDTDIKPQQAAYIQKYVDSFETALFGANFQDPVNGFRRYASEKSLMDYLFLNEMSKNVDGYRLSTFMYKDKRSKGGKLNIGPAWDYDIAWFNADYCESFLVTGWAYDLNYVCAGAAVPAWWERLRQDSLFNQHLYCRWNYLRSNVYSFDSLFAFIDSTAAYIDEGQQRNFVTWPIIGVATWPEPTPLPQTYAEEIARLKNWISVRFAWLDLQFNALAHHPVPVVLGNDTAFCSGNSLQLYAGDFDAYLWSTGDVSAVAYATQTGSYSVTVSDNFQCSGSDAVNVQILPLPEVSIGTDTTICEGNTLMLAAANGVQYLWSTGDTVSVVNVNQTNAYSVTVTGSNTCTASDGINVAVQPLPDATIQVVTSIDAAFQFASADTTGNTSLWYFGNGDSSTAHHPFYNYHPAFGYFLVTHIVTDAYGCSSMDTATVYIYNVGIGNISSDNIRVYPNPAKEQLTVSSAEPVDEISINDVIGNLVLKQQTNNKKQETVVVSSFPSGVYFVEVRTGGKTFTAKFVKE